MYKVQVYKYCIHIQYTYYDMYVYKTNNKYFSTRVCQIKLKIVKL